MRNEFGQYDNEFALRDHLGNTRVTFKDGTNKGAVYYDWATYTYIDPNQGNTGYNDGVVGVSDIKQINNYYPFGLNMEGNWNGAAGANKYQYNGKQWNDDFSLGWNDYGARFYDAAVGRWFAVDPLSYKFSTTSPYVYVKNNPSKYIDPNGMELYVANNDSKALDDIVKLALKDTKSGNVLIITSTKKGEEYTKLSITSTGKGDFSANSNVLIKISESEKKYLYGTGSKRSEERRVGKEC